MKPILVFFQLFKINKNIQDTLSLCVAHNGTKKPGTTYLCTSLLSTGGSPVSFLSFVNFSQFNLHFHEFRNCLFMKMIKGVNKKMKIVFLDAKSIGDDIDLSGFDQLGEVVKYGFSTPEEAGERTKDADVVSNGFCI